MAYEGQDKIDYQAGNWYLPPIKYQLPYQKLATTEEDQTTASGTGAGIPYTNAFTNSGGGDNPSELLQTWRTEDVVPDQEEDKSWLSNLFSKFSTPKVRGTLGERMSKQPRVPLPAAMASWSLSPFNEASRNYNSQMIDQLNYLEGLEGYIGRDSRSGHLKYGPESVLSGKNVLSFGGTNDYQEALNKEIGRLQGIYDKQKDLYDEGGEDAMSGTWTYDKLKAWKKKKLDKAMTEKTNLTGTDDPKDIRLGKNLVQNVSYKSDPKHSIEGREKYTGPGMAFEQKKSETFTTPKGEIGYSGGRKDGGRIGYRGGQLVRPGPGRPGYNGGDPIGGYGPGGSWNGGDGDNEPPTKKKLSISPIIGTKRSDLGYMLPTGVVGFDASTPLGKLKAKMNLKNYVLGEDIEPQIDYTKNIGDFNIAGTTNLDDSNLSATYNKGPLSIGATIDDQGNKYIGGKLSWKWGGEDGGLVSIL